MCAAVVLLSRHPHLGQALSDASMCSPHFHFQNLLVLMFLQGAELLTFPWRRATAWLTCAPRGRGEWLRSTRCLEQAALSSDKAHRTAGSFTLVFEPCHLAGTKQADCWRLMTAASALLQARLLAAVRAPCLQLDTSGLQMPSCMS